MASRGTGGNPSGPNGRDQLPLGRPSRLPAKDHLRYYSTPILSLISARDFFLPGVNLAEHWSQF
jgi:hypothetical protein